MPVEAMIAVLLAALLHAGWNAAAKSAARGDAMVSTLAIVMGGAVAALPMLLVSGLPSPACLWWLVASGLIHVVYFVLVGFAYRSSDYSAVYPIMRGAAPLATAMLGTMLLGETLSLLSWSGVLLVAGGVLGIGSEAMRGGRFSASGLKIALANAAVIIAYTLVDGIGVRLSGNAAGYVLAMMVLTAVGTLPLLPWLIGAQSRDAVVARLPFGIVGGSMVVASYGIALWAMTKAPIGAVAALRETSVLFATVIAAVVLKERFGLNRWLGAAAIVGGLVTLRLG